MDMTKLQGLVKARQNELEARKTSGVKYEKPLPGATKYRILPGWNPDNREGYFHDFGQHWIKDEADTVTAVIVSEADTFNRPCEIGQVVWGAIRATKDDKTIERLKDLTSRRVVLVNALIMDGPKADPKKPILLALPAGQSGPAVAFHNLLGARFSDGINLLDLNAGRDVIITRTGSGFDTKYSLVDAANNSAVADPSVMDRLINIDAFIENERSRGIQKGIDPVNKAIAHILGIAVPAGRSSLVNTTVKPAAALTAERPMERETVATPVETVAAAVVAPVTVPVAGGGSTIIVSDDELQALLDEVDAK